MKSSASTTSLSSTSSDAPRSNVRVCCRVRPHNSKELNMSNAKKSVFVNGDQLEVKTADGGQTFTYDHVFDECDGQQVVFDSVARPVVQDIMDGYNATIFAYGQTSSGKTYTMEGASIDDPQLRGIIPRTATEIFNNVMAADENMEFIVKVSYIEIYMERIRDLLDPYKSKVNLQVREDSQRGIFVEGMTEISVTSDDELLSTMRDGAANRAVAATGMNEGSSRSHSVFMVTLYQRNLANQATKAGKLYLVDLAGSEMVRKTGASGKQLEEAKTINKSLSALGNVINALTDGSATHIPYRDSKLTRVLQESLGGNSRTHLIVNVSPSSYNTSETISTLRFGNRAKSIKNKAVVNEQRSVEEYKVMLAKCEKTISAQQTYIISLEQRLVSAGIDLKKDSSGAAGVGVGAGAGGARSRKNSARASMNKTSNDPAAVVAAATAELEDEQPGAAGSSSSSDDGDDRLRRSSSIRAAQALEELQDKVTQLEDELNEEKAESTRRAQEIFFLTAKCDEQAQQISTNSDVATSFRHEKESQLKQMDDKLFQRETQFTELQSELEKLTFEHQELNIHAEKVQREYDTLFQELKAFTSATAASSGATSTTAAPGSPSRRLSVAVAALAAQQSAQQAATSAAAAVSTSPPPSPKRGLVEVPASSSASTADQEKAAEPVVTASPMPPPAPLVAPPSEAAAPSFSSSSAGESSTESSVDLTTRCHSLEEELRQYEKDYRLLQVATEREKGRLLDDLENKKSQIRELELQLDGATSTTSTASSSTTSSTPTTSGGAAAAATGTTTTTATPVAFPTFQGPSGMSARERQHMRSIQQKLEQLVAVHRQLLRKYASLELELAEAKKKITLRDERIKQVEGNNRIMAGNMRLQAEKHVEELTHLRDQIADFRGAQRSHFESQLQQQQLQHEASANVIKTLRGGSIYNTEGVIRPIRGGGRRKTSAGTTNTTSASMSSSSTNGLAASSLQTVASPSSSSSAAGAASSAGAPSSGFLTRLFGGKSS